MTAYEQWELAAAAEDDRVEREMAEIVKYEESLREVCEEYAINAYDYDGDIHEVMSAFYDTHDESEWAILHDHMKQERLATEEYILGLSMGCDVKEIRQRCRHHHSQVINWLTRAVDRGCLLDED